MMDLLERFKDAWSIFRGNGPTFSPGGYAGSSRPDRVRLKIYHEKSVVTSVYNQIAVDCSSVNINHVQLDKSGRFLKIIKDSLNRILTMDANIDQTGRALIRDIVLSMLDEGVVALVPIITSENIHSSNSYKVFDVRVGKILEWYPRDIMVDVYDDRTGVRKQVVLPKCNVPIFENPFYTIMNEPNSTYKRLARVLAQLDSMNSEISSGKLDLIVQLPFPTRSNVRQKQAEGRRADIQRQLNSETGARYGIAYIDSSEKVIQLNRSLENNLWEQVKDLKAELFSQLGFSPTIFDGSADEKTMLNYNNRTIEPILSTITEEIERKWLSKTARTQGQAIRFYRDPFRLVPIKQMAEIADTFTRNEIATSNEIRTALGMTPSDDPKADMLVNSNLNQPPKELSQFNGDNNIQNE